MNTCIACETKCSCVYIRGTHKRNLCSPCEGVQCIICRPNAAVIPQPAPKKNESPSIHDLVIEDMAARKAFGLKKYGTILQANNGRDQLMDAYQEALDLCVYLRAAISERDSKKG